MIYKGVGKGGSCRGASPPRFCGVDIFPIQKLLKFSAGINVQAIHRSTGGVLEK